VKNSTYYVCFLIFCYKRTYDITIFFSNWNCRQSASMTTLVESWRGIIPNWILNSVVEQLIMPRLEQEVDEWNPLTDVVPVHQWLHPWIPYAKDRLISSVYPVIRRKLSAALTAWHPSDKSALLMLKPWKQAFPQGDMDAFLMTNILPKLQVAMQELVINPHQQHLGRIKNIDNFFKFKNIHFLF
jgi:tuftelin-interacting protein 11